MASRATTTPVRLDGQAVLVTGGGRGLGRSFAHALAAAGASVAVAARSAEQLAETVDLIARQGGHAVAFPLDVTDRHAVTQMVGEVERQLGPISLLVNNAAVAAPLGPAWQVEPDEWWHTLDINVRGTFLCAHAVLPGMVERRRGRIINVATTATVLAYGSAYGTSKAAIIGFSEILAVETREYGIGVFAINPGLVRTAMTEYLAYSAAGQQWLPWGQALLEGGQALPPERAADLVLQLAAGRADSLSGRFLDVTDDIDALLGRVEEITRDDLYTMRLRRKA